jgi:hypothetical protein
MVNTVAVPHYSHPWTGSAPGAWAWHTVPTHFRDRIPLLHSEDGVLIDLHKVLEFKCDVLTDLHELALLLGLKDGELLTFMIWFYL